MVEHILMAVDNVWVVIQVMMPVHMIALVLLVVWV
jgi:hypothetical protein